MSDRKPRSADRTPDSDVRGFSFVLERDAEQGLRLRAGHRHGFGPILADWLHPEVQRRVAAGKRQPLARSIGLHKRGPDDAPLTMLDATAGLGRDGYVLAALGARVTLAERNPTVSELLGDALDRLRAQPQQQMIASRLEVIHSDAKALFISGRRWDAVYLDPMYPDDGKTALPSKEMQILRDLTGGDADADSLLAPALECAKSRVIVKRPLKAPWLANAEPSMQISSTQLRFDVYLKA